ncbi:MAG: Flp family type IVb pilin [Pseudomonadota bacterium]
MLRLYIAASNLQHSALAGLRRLCGDKAGVTAIEYGLIAGAIAVAIIAVVLALGEDIKALFTKTSGAMKKV